MCFYKNLKMINQLMNPFMCMGEIDQFRKIAFVEFCQEFMQNHFYVFQKPISIHLKAFNAHQNSKK